METDVVVIGAGAAGMMAAAEAGRRGRRVVLVEHWPTIGERIRVSGGGRCNFTNRTLGAEHYLSRNPHFCRSALSRYTPQDFIALLDRHGVPYEEREHGQMFCTRSASDITSLLRTEVDRAGVRWATPCAVDHVSRCASPAAGGPRFVVSTSEGPFGCASVIVATGGLACPRIGATSFAYDVARHLGLGVVTPCPALVPVTLAEAEFAPLRPLAGVAFESECRCPEASRSPRFLGRSLITHRGLSGPAILQVSSYWQLASAQRGAPAAIAMDLAPGHDVASGLVAARQSRQSLATVLGTWLPRRLALAWSQHYAWPATTAELSNAAVSAIARQVNDWTVIPTGSLGFDKAEVTLGGVDTDGLSSQTMEARDVPGLYFVGEAVDVTGWLGGYNFQWAWSSGWAAGQYA